MLYSEKVPKPKWPRLTTAGFSIVELLLGIFFLTLFISGTIFLLVENVNAVVTNADRIIATNLAQEGIEALYSIRNINWCDVRIGTHGLDISSNRWVLAGSSDAQSKFTRTVTIDPVYRDASGAIVPQGTGSPDGSTKKVTVTVSWVDAAGASQSVRLEAYVTYWNAVRNGTLVYADSGAAADIIKYRTLDNFNGTWALSQNTADVDPATTNKKPHAIQLYASPYRDEKIMISRHVPDASLDHALYAQVFNCSGWGNLIQLAGFNTTVPAYTLNFSGTYLANGDFMVIYSDNTTVPKFRIWDGAAWSDQKAMVDNALNAGSIPTYIVAKARPGTKEVMAAFLDQDTKINTQYFNGGVYDTASWTLHPIHAIAAPSFTKKMVDFEWSRPNLTKGMLIFAKEVADKRIHARVWTANGTGGGSWGAIIDSPLQSNVIGSLTVKARPFLNEFSVCYKDSKSPPQIVCLRIFATSAWSTPRNSNITNTTDDGVPTSFDLGFEDASALEAIIVYSDGTASPKLKKYSVSSVSWDKNPISIPSVFSTLETVRVIPFARTNDILVLLADSNQFLSSVVWNGTTNVLYTFPSGYGFFVHGSRGSADEDFWYDFALDQF